MQELLLPVQVQEPGIRVLVVGDEELARLGFCAALAEAPGIGVVGHAPVSGAGPSSLREGRPDVVLLSTGTDGDWAGAVLAMRTGTPGRPGARVIVVVDGGDEDQVMQAVCAGASGVLLRNVSAAELDYAIRQVAQGYSVLSPAVTSWMLTRLRALATLATLGRRGGPGNEALSGLSERERQILAALAVGKSNQEIAAEAHLSLATVKSHVSSVLAKLDVRDRLQAALFGVSAGIGSDACPQLDVRVLPDPRAGSQRVDGTRTRRNSAVPLLASDPKKP